MVGVWMSERLVSAIKEAIRVNSDFTISEFVRDAVALRLRQEYPNIWEKLRKGEKMG